MVNKKPAIKIIGSEWCTGCFSCFNACPTAESVVMKYDENGFYKPFITEKCNHCGICQNSCPVIVNPKTNFDVQKAYLGWSLNNEIIKKSSSGGIFSELSSLVLSCNGAVYGAGWVNENIKHIRITNFNEINKIQGSKYIQSDIGHSYIRASEDIKNGKFVLFSGLPCQIAAINNIIKNKENLLTVDVICHGVPSEKAFKKYCQESYTNRVIKVDFRSKDKGWDKYSLCFYCDNGRVFKNIFKYNRFFQGYLKNIYLNEACYACYFKGNEDGGGRVADITLGDFWGVPKKYYNSKGVSFIVANNEKGDLFVNRLNEERNVYLEGIDISLGLKENPCYYESVKRPANRDLFFNQIDDMSFKKLSVKYFKPPMKAQEITREIFLFVKRAIRYLLKHLIISKKFRR